MHLKNVVRPKGRARTLLIFRGLTIRAMVCLDAEFGIEHVKHLAPVPAHMDDDVWTQRHGRGAPDPLCRIAKSQIVRNDDCTAPRHLQSPRKIDLHLARSWAF